MRIDSKSAARRGRPSKPGAEPRSFAPKGLRSNEPRSFIATADGWQAETEFVSASARPALDIHPPANQSEALAVARLIAAELAQPDFRLRIAAAAEA